MTVMKKTWWRRTWDTLNVRPKFPVCRAPKTVDPTLPIIHLDCIYMLENHLTEKMQFPGPIQDTIPNPDDIARGSCQSHRYKQFSPNLYKCFGRLSSDLHEVKRFRWGKSLWIIFSFFLLWSVTVNHYNKCAILLNIYKCCIKLHTLETIQQDVTNAWGK